MGARAFLWAWKKDDTTNSINRPDSADVLKLYQGLFTSDVLRSLLCIVSEEMVERSWGALGDYATRVSLKG